MTALLAFFQAIPAIFGGINNFVSKYYDAKVQITTARIGGDTQVAKALVAGVVGEGQVRVEFLRAVSQSKFLMMLVGSFALPWIAYEWKVVLWDNLLCFWIYGSYGYTPPIKGNVGEWAGVIIGGIFGTGSVMAAANAYFNRRQ